jgi:hypothetical protein
MKVEVYTTKPIAQQAKESADQTSHRQNDLKREITNIR